MPIQTTQLEALLREMSSSGAPGLEFCQAIIELARTDRFAQLRDVLPAVVYEELWQRYQHDPAAFIANWQQLAQKMQQGFVHHARQRLTSLTRLQYRDAESGSAPSWQSIQLALDAQQNDLLRAAFAWELVELIEPSVTRATHLRECIVATPSSEEADRYLDEATRCYFFGLFTASAIMCRAVLEEAVKRRLPANLTEQANYRYRNAPTLGNLLHEVHNNLRASGIHPRFPKLANRVNEIGTRAIHQGLLTEDEARQCLQNARQALELLLKTPR